MPNTSIHFPQDLLDEIDARVGEDESRSEWIKQACRRQLKHDHDDLDELETRVEELEEELSTVKAALLQAAAHSGYRDYGDISPGDFLDDGDSDE